MVAHWRAECALHDHAPNAFPVRRVGGRVAADMDAQTVTNARMVGNG